MLLIIGFPIFTTLFSTINSHSNKIVVDKEVEISFLANSEAEFVVIFFGYVGCVDICTPILSEIDDIYNSQEFTTLKNYVEFNFINLTPNIDPDQSELFAKNFNQNFIGIHLSKKQLLNIDREFRLFFSDSLLDKRELNHSDHIYLLQKSKKGRYILKNIYTTHPLNKKLFTDDIITLKDVM